MEPGDTSNDNRRRDRAGLDPDRHYVDEYMAKAWAHLKERGFNRETIADAALSEMFKLLDGNPFRSPADEGALRSDQQLLWRMKHRVQDMSEQWDKGWIRAQYEKRPTYRFNRAARRPLPALPERLEMPLPDINRRGFMRDLRALKLRPGFPYSDNEILTRYRRQLAKVAPNRRAGSKERVKRINDAKNGVLAFFRENRHLAKVRDAG